MTKTKETGDAGEECAALYLAQHGYDIRERNVRFGKYEIDIVAHDRKTDMLVFVEVKTRSTHDPRYPVRTAVDPRKRIAMRAAVARYVNHHQYEGAGRIDIVSVAAGSVIEHIVDIGSSFL